MKFFRLFEFDTLYTLNTYACIFSVLYKSYKKRCILLHLNVSKLRNSVYLEAPYVIKKIPMLAAVQGLECWSMFGVLDVCRLCLENGMLAWDVVAVRSLGCWPLLELWMLADVRKLKCWLLFRAQDIGQCSELVLLVALRALNVGRCSEAGMLAIVQSLGYWPVF